MALIRQPTRLLTNMKRAHVVSSKRCNHEHRHVQTLDINVKLVKEYPEDLLRAMLETLRLERGDGVESDRSEVCGFCLGFRAKWVDTQKGEDVRCRIVGQEFAAGDPRTDLFASTPLLFLARSVVSMAAWERASPWSLMALDVSCAFVHVKVLWEIYIELSSEDSPAAEGNYGGRMKPCTGHGTQPNSGRRSWRAH